LSQKPSKFKKTLHINLSDLTGKWIDTPEVPENPPPLAARSAVHETSNSQIYEKVISTTFHLEKQDPSNKLRQRVLAQSDKGLPQKKFFLQKILFSCLIFFSSSENGG
jgi:hypothetical protein